MRFYHVLVLCVLLFCLVPGAHGQIQITWNTPNGNPTPPNRGFVQLDPCCSWVITWIYLGYYPYNDTFLGHSTPSAATWSMNPATMDNVLMDNLAANGVADQNHGGQWTVNNAFFNGTMTLNTYDAWLGNSPQVPWQGNMIQAQGYGGGVMALTYEPGPGDPPGDVTGNHWLQLVYLANGQYPSVGAPYKGYNPVQGAALDNAFTRAGDTWPFYDGYTPDGVNNYGGTADNTTFVDLPAFPRGSGEAYFQLRLATWDLANKVINISNQVLQWGVYVY